MLNVRYTIKRIARSGNVQTRLYNLNQNSYTVHASSKTVADSIIQSKSCPSEVYKKTTWDAHGLVVEGMLVSANLFLNSEHHT